MTHRIGLTGAQGTGKSIVANALADRLLAEGAQIALYSGLAEEVGRLGFTTGALASAESVRAFVRLHLAREAAGAAAVQIFDRCLLDALAYAYVLACLPAAEFHELRRYTTESCARMSLLLWLRVTADYPVLDPADETPEFRRAVDLAIGRLARKNGIAVVEHALPATRIDDLVSEICGFVIAR